MPETPSTILTRLAEELAAISQEGIQAHATEYDEARYRRMAVLADDLTALAADPEHAIVRTNRSDLDLRTSIVACTAAIFDEQGRILLVQRSDNARWCMPGGAADVGEPPSHVAEREALEETGLTVRAVRLATLHLSRGMMSGLHICQLDFLCERTGGEPTLTGETLDCRYVTEQEAAALPLHGTHTLRVPAAFRAYRGETPGTTFQPAIDVS